jgi:WD40 repeat protein
VPRGCEGLAEVMRRLLVPIFALTAATAQAPPVWRLEPLSVLELDGGVTCKAAFAPDGRTLATASERGDVMLVELPARTVRWRVTPGDHWVGELAFAPDGKTVACMGRHLTLHDVVDGREVGTWSHTGPNGFAWRVDGAGYAFSRHGGITTVDAKGRVQQRVEFDYPINALAFAPDGSLFAGDNVGRTWRIPAGGGSPCLWRDRRTKEWDGVRSLALAWGGEHLFDLASDGTLFRGDEALAKGGTTYWLSVAPDGTLSAIAGGSRSVRWWPTPPSEPRVVEFDANIAAIAIAPDVRTTFVATVDGRQVLHREGGAAIELPGHKAPVGDYTLSPDGAFLAVAYCGAEIWQVMPVRGGAPRTLRQCDAVRPGRRGSELLICGEQRLALIEGHTGKEIVAIDEPSGLWHDSALGPDERFFCGHRRALVDPRDGAAIPFPEDLLLHGVGDTACASDGSWAVGAAAGIDGDLGALWVTDVHGRTLFSCDEGPVYSLAFSPDGKRLYYSRGEGTSVGMGPPGHVLCVRDTADWKLLNQKNARIGEWRFLDQTTALTTVNGQLQVWDATTLQSVQTIATDSPMHDFQLSADARTLVWSDHRQVFVYRLVAEPGARLNRGR